MKLATRPRVGTVNGVCGKRQEAITFVVAVENARSYTYPPERLYAAANVVPAGEVRDKGSQSDAVAGRVQQQVGAPPLFLRLETRE